MSDQQSLRGLTAEVLKITNEVDAEYTEFCKVMTNSNRFNQAVTSSSNVNSMYNNFKTLTNNSNVSIVQDYQYVDTLQGSFKIYYNNIALKWNKLTRCVSLNSGTDITFGIYDDPKVNRNSEGRVALFDRATGLAMRHYGWGAITFTPFQANNWDMDWFIYKTASGKYELQNDWVINWNFLTLGYDAVNDKFVTKGINDPSRVRFTFGAGIPDAYLTPNKSGLYCRILSGYFNDSVPYISTTANINTPYLETHALNIANTANGTGYNWLYTDTRSERFTVVWKGYFYAPTTGTYTFNLTSDDASYLWIGSNALSGYTTGNADINNGGGHVMIKKSVSKSLTSGTYYPLLIVYGENVGPNDINFSWKPPGSAETSTASGYLFLNAPV